MSDFYIGENLITPSILSQKCIPPPSTLKHYTYNPPYSRLKWMLVSPSNCWNYFYTLKSDWNIFDGALQICETVITLPKFNKNHDLFEKVMLELALEKDNHKGRMPTPQPSSLSQVNPHHTLPVPLCSPSAIWRTQLLRILHFNIKVIPA